MTAAERPAGPHTRVREFLVAGAALALFAAAVGLVLSLAGATLGYDYDAYVSAARRLSEGLALYDQSISSAGGHAIFLYPPPFAVAFLPMVAIPDAVARLGWSITMAVCVALGAMLVPVRRDVRVLLLVLAALDWPVLYAVKLGQVGPLLFLAMALGWRFLDRALPLAATIAIGGLVKVQPALLVLWALAARRNRAALAAVGMAALVMLLCLFVTGPGAWFDYLGLLNRVSGAATTPRNTSPAAIAFDMGLSLQAAAAIQTAFAVIVGAVTLVSWRRLTADASFLVTILASQLATPLLWDHYSLFLLLPTAWLLQRGRAWAVAFPLLGWTSLAIGPGRDSWAAAVTVPLAFAAMIAALLLEGRRPSAGGILEARPPRRRSARRAAAREPSAAESGPRGCGRCPAPSAATSGRAGPGTKPRPASLPRPRAGPGLFHTTGHGSAQGCRGASADPGRARFANVRQSSAILGP